MSGGRFNVSRWKIAGRNGDRQRGDFLKQDTSRLVHFLNAELGEGGVSAVHHAGGAMKCFVEPGRGNREKKRGGGVVRFIDFGLMGDGRLKGFRSPDQPEGGRESKRFRSVVRKGRPVLATRKGRKSQKKKPCVRVVNKKEVNPGRIKNFLQIQSEATLPLFGQNTGNPLSPLRDKKAGVGKSLRTQ